VGRIKKRRADWRSQACQQSVNRYLHIEIDMKDEKQTVIKNNYLRDKNKKEGKKGYE